MPQTPEDRFDASWAAVALFGTLVSGLIALAYTFLRLGLATPAALAPTGVVTLAAALFAPLLLPRRGALANTGARAAVYPLVTFTVLASVVLAFWTGSSLVFAYPVLAIAGVARAIPHARRATRSDWLGLLAISVFVAAYLFVVVSNLDYAGVYTPEQGLLGLLNHDTRFHATVTYLIQNFGTPSLGVDGILPLNYHYGSHIWFAAFGRLTGAEPLYSYGAGVLIVAVPALINALLFSGLAIDTGRKSARAYFLLGLLLLFLADAIGPNSYYISETYTFALIGLLLFLPLASRLAAGESGIDDRAGFAFGVVAIPLLMSLKVSVGILWAVGLGWIALRRFGIGIVTISIGAGSLAALIAGLYMFAPATGDYVHTNSSAFAPFYILRAFPELKMPFSSFVLPFCLALLAFAGTGSIRNVIARKTSPLVEAAIVVALVGAIPAYIGVPQDSAAWYFLNVGQWWAMPMLVAHLAPEDFAGLRDRIAPDKLARPVAVVLAFLILNQLVQSMTPTFQKTYREILAAADRQAGGGLLQGRTATRYLRDSIATERALFGADFRKALSDSVGTKLISEVQAAGPARPDQAVFVSPAYEAFWTFQAVCRDKHNIQVSLTGQPSLLGGPPKAYGCIRDAYQTNYGDRIDSRTVTDDELCAHARERKIYRVVVVNGARNDSRILKCQ